jgi:membrane protein implicated in regulation of membrane protease activity
MKIILSNDEWDRAPWYHRVFAVIVGNVGCLVALAVPVLLLILGVYLLTAIPLKIYIAAVIVILLLILLRLSPKRADEKSAGDAQVPSQK